MNYRNAYYTMKKTTLFFFVSVLVAAVSCNKSTSPVTPDPTPTTDPEMTVEFVLPVTSDNQLDFFEQQFEFDLNGTKVTFKESDMTQMTDKLDLERISYLTKSTAHAFVIMFGADHKKTPKYYKYTIGKLKKGETVSAVTRKPIIKSDRPSDEEITILIGYDLLIDGKEQAIADVNFHGGVPNTNEAITSLFNILDKDFRRITYSFK